MCVQVGGANESICRKLLSITPRNLQHTSRSSRYFPNPNNQAWCLVRGSLYRAFFSVFSFSLSAVQIMGDLSGLRREAANESRVCGRASGDLKCTGE